MIRRLLSLMLMASIAFGCAAQATDYAMHYDVDLDTARHYLNVRLTYSGKHEDHLTLKMPVWAPGYYEILNFPKHLCDFRAMDASGRDIRWTKTGKNAWQIDMPEDGNMQVTYRIYANQRDVASSRVDDKAAFIAPNGVFMFVAGDVQHPVSVTYNMPANWKHISTGLKADKGNAHRFTAANFDILYDSPLLLGNHEVKAFSHEGRDYELAFETPDGVEESGFEDAFRRIVSAATDMMRDVPYDNYTLIHMGKGQVGLEHLNSQACYTDGTYRYDDHMEWLNFLGFVAHEYFHLYNVKTIRPIELGPFDYDKEALTPLLWFSEGVTCYYEATLLERAGLASETEKLELLSKYMRMDEPYEGHHHQSLRSTSYDIWYDFMNNDANSRDVRINYYFRGPVVGLIMDIEIRRLSGGRRSLDDLMRLLYNRYHKQQNRGFTEEEFWDSVDEVAGAPMDHVRYLVDNPVDIDYEKYFAPAGLELDRTTWTIRPSKARRTS